jgi:anti-sigma B factor antagonist
MPDAGFSVEVIRGVPVVATPEDVDINNAAGLRAALLQSAALGPGTLVVDMTRTQFCDTAGLHALVAAHKRATAAGGRVLLVLPGATVLRIFSITGLDGVIPNFPSLAEALAAAVTRSGPAGSPGPWSPGLP